MIVNKKNIFDTIGFFFIFLLILAVPFNKPLVNISSAVILLCYFCSGNLCTKKKAFNNPLVIVFLLLLFWAFIGCFYSYSLSIALKSWKGYILWLYPVIFYPFLYRNNLRIKVCLAAVFVTFSFFLVSMYVNFFFLTPSNAISINGGVYPVPSNHFITAIIYMYLIFSFYFLASQAKSSKVRILCFVMCFIALVADLGINSSRMGYLTELTILLILFLSRWRFKGLLIFSVACLVGVTLLYNFSSTFKFRVNQGIDNTISYAAINNQLSKDKLNAKINTSFGLRLFHLEQTVNMMIDAGFVRNSVGYGTGSYEHMAKKYIQALPSNNIYSYAKPDYWGPDNNYLVFWTENGLVGVAVFLFGAIYLYRKSQMINSYYKDIAKVGLLILIVASACANMDIAILSRLIFMPILLTYMFGFINDVKTKEDH